MNPWTAACQAPLSFTVSRSLLRFMSIESVMPSDHLTLCRPLLLLPSVLPNLKIFSGESTLTSGGQSIGALASASVLPGLISFRTDWFDLLAVQRTLKRLLQHYSSKALILHCSDFFMVQLSHPYMITGKTIDLTRWTLGSKVMSPC